MTPAAVSYQIKEMEDRLGIALFQRGSRGLRLTPAGAALLEAVEEALDRLERAVLHARRIDRGGSHLRISLSARFATNWLLPRLPRFENAYPSIDLRLDIADRLRDFQRDDVDLAIRFSRPGGEGLRSERLFDTVIVPVCSRKRADAGPLPRTPRELAGLTLCHVDWTGDGMVWPNWKMWMAAAGVEDFDESRCIAFPDTSFVVQAVTEGDAIGLADLEMIRNDLSEGRLVRLFDVGVGVANDYAYRLVYPEINAGDSRIAAFRSWLLQEAKQDQQG